jgi:transcriptional antiterminator RfaH
MNWFAIHSKRFREVLASASVGALGCEVFLPMAKVDLARCAVIKADSKPLFPSYFFARFDPAVSLDAVECARDVLYVLKAGSYPVPVEDGILVVIQSRAEADGLIRLHRPDIKPGDRVSIEEGPFAGMMGQVEAELDDSRRVAILLETLWNARVVLERDCIEPAGAA